MAHPSVTWHYMAPDPELGLDTTKDPSEAVRREWWYEPSNTYVYQLRQPDGSWGEVFDEYEDEGFPAWVGDALRDSGVPVPA